MAVRNVKWAELLPDTWEGLLRLRVRGRSMSPTLRVGDEVLVEPVVVKDLRRGDWVVLRAPAGALIHRFLGQTRDGRLLTKGDGHRAPDPLWAPDALLGRAVTLIRDGKTISIADHAFKERLKTLWHQSLAATWRLLRRGGLLLALCFLLPLVANAAVTLVSFEAEAQTDSVDVTWSTASEVNMLGFYLQRGLEDEFSSYERISELIPAVGEIAGADYAVEDTDVEEGETYYYTLEALETDGSAEFHGPISVTMPGGEEPTPDPTGEATSTSTPIPTPTPTATSAPQSGSPLPTPVPYVNFSASALSLQAGECSTLQWQTTNVGSVYLDGQGVAGNSGKTFCPCETESHTLRVFYPDGSFEDRTLTLEVSGTCPEGTGSRSETATPTPQSNATSTPRPTPRPTLTPTPTPTPTPSPTPTSTLPSPTPTSTTETPGMIPSPTPTLLSSQSITVTAAEETSPLTTPTTALDDTPSLADGTPVTRSGNGWLAWVLVLAGALISAGGWGVYRSWLKGAE